MKTALLLIVLQKCLEWSSFLFGEEVKLLFQVKSAVMWKFDKQFGVLFIGRIVSTRFQL